MKIFITGGTGFIGRYVVELLQRNGHTVSVLSRFAQKNVQTIVGDLGQIQFWEEEVHAFAPDAIMHLAWEGLPDFSKESSKRNKVYGELLFSLLSRTRCRKVIVTGSCLEYLPKKGLLTEESPTKATNSFTQAKLQIFKKGLAYAKENNICFLWVRPFYVYGIGQREASLIPSIAHSLENKTPPVLSHPSTALDYIHVTDVASGLVALTEKANESGIYNISSGKATAIEQIVTLFSHIANTKIKPIYQEKTPVPLNWFGDHAKISHAVGWQPKMTLTTGIQQYLHSL